ncbi:hypothetical protein L1987_85510 [Smallanthus sonchifolius]|uniref:Uncharacterized protein n=1 Tax=Smallanthus sonchifolius TaxID=185202 RepID=A0ACB8XX64_9ASTR|nr:hypothetical protein L1987_85510 [Smallanthus sonchifolius]
MGFNVQSGFDAKDSIKHSATVQAYFRLQKPVSYLLPRITRLEYDIYSEIGVPDTQVAILSMHKASASNWTHVVFAVLPNPINSSINPMSFSVLRSSLLDLFNQRSNLTLTPSIFSQPSSFDILKFPGGITVIPKQQSASIWMLRQALFNFTLPNSVREIEENFGELKEQLKSGLHLKSYESVHMQTEMPPGLPPLPVVSYGSRVDQEKEVQKVSASPPVSVSPSSSSSAACCFNHITWALFFFFTLVTLQTI